MAAHRKYRKLVPLAVVVCVVVTAALGGYALGGSRGTAAVKLASASRASGQGVTVYACLASGKLTHVSVGSAPKCRGKSAPVHWAAQSGPSPSPSPVPSASSSSSPSPSSPPSPVPTKSPSPSPTQTSTSPGPWAWCSSAAFGERNTDDRFDLYNNEWNTSDNPGPQTICGNSASDWQVTSTQRAGNTAVLTYPSVQLNYNGSNGYPLSRFTSMTSSYAETMHAVSGTDAEAAYDIWLNGLRKEVMVWVDNHGQAPAGSKVATTTFSGATWDLYETSDRSYMAFVRQGNASSGTVDLHAALSYLEGRGDLKASDVLWQVNFGWEICSTGGAPETFTTSNFSLASTPTS